VRKRQEESKRRARGNELQARTIGRGEGDAAKKGEAVDVTRKNVPLYDIQIKGR